MRIEYELIDEDFLDFNRSHAQQSVVFRSEALRQRLMGAIGTGCGILLFSSAMDFSPLKTGLSVLIGTAAMWFIVPMLMQAAHERSLKALGANGGLGTAGRYVLEISVDGLRASDPTAESFIRWSGIHRINENEKFGYIFVRPHAAIILPKRAGADAVVTILNAARQHHEAASTVTTPEP